jgi:hypothetical protein
MPGGPAILQRGVLPSGTNAGPWPGMITEAEPSARTGRVLHMLRVVTTDAGRPAGQPERFLRGSVAGPDRGPCARAVSGLGRLTGGHFTPLPAPTTLFPG